MPFISLDESVLCAEAESGLLGSDRPIDESSDDTMMETVASLPIFCFFSGSVRTDPRKSRPETK